MPTQENLDLHDILYDFLMGFLTSYNNALVEPEEVDGFIRAFVIKLRAKNLSVK